jgi:CO/xanthine dehydrogenase Mo-binding subunit
VSVQDLVLDGEGHVFVAGSPAKTLSIADLASRAQFQYGRTIAGRGAWMKPRSVPDPETGAMDPDSTQAYACTVAEVEVDSETGIVRVISIRSAYEVGRQINPTLVQGQITGGAWMGMSHALYETTEPYYPARDHSPKDFAEYLMPGPKESPVIASVVLEVPSANGPYGVKGVGEMTANSPIPAIVNAIFDATGVRVDHLPVRPEDILRGLDELAAAGAAEGAA